MGGTIATRIINSINQAVQEALYLLQPCLETETNSRLELDRDMTRPAWTTYR